MKPTKPTTEIDKIKKWYDDLDGTKRLMMWCVIVAFISFIISFQLGINQGIALSNISPTPTFTLMGAVDYAMTFQMPIFMWGILFLFLWLTKW